MIFSNLSINSNEGPRKMVRPWMNGNMRLIKGDGFTIDLRIWERRQMRRGCAVHAECAECWQGFSRHLPCTAQGVVV